ncbi:MAG: hypothetical protein GC205_11300 [Bacteroidetes bacterium]|nr:hypothetical protein [Bacteroidota bacterium]
MTLQLLPSRFPQSGLILFALLFSATALFAQMDTRYHRVRVQASGAQLSALGIAADHGLRKADLWFEGDFCERELAIIREAGFSHSILQPDMSGYYAARIAADVGFEAGRAEASQQPRDERFGPGAGACARIPSDFLVPDAFVAGSMGGYYTMQEVYAQMDSMAARYPALVSPRTAFGSQLTHQGRQQFLLKISDNVSADESAEPNVLYTSLIHAREPAGMMSVLFYMNWLLENYGSDDRATYVINNAQLYFVPVVNPDGYEINRISNPGGGGLWRKNARNNGGSTGVDLNRNWPYEWGYDDAGSSPVAASDVYRGPSAGSEPEISNLMELSVERNFRTALNYHSFGDLLIYPWGYDFVFTPDHGTFRRGAKSMVADNFYNYGTPYQTVTYAVNGSSDDWFYGEQTLKDKTFAWTPEVGELGFWPPPSQIVPMAQENALANLLLAFFGTRYAAVTALDAPLAERQGVFRHRIIGYGEIPVNAQVSLEALSPNLEVDAGSVAYADLEAGQERDGELTYRLHPSTKPGDAVRYALVLRWPGFEHRETVETIFGLEQQVLVPSEDWQPWTEQPGGPWVWSDSPEKNYTNAAAFEGNIGTLDLSGQRHSRLLLDLRWDLEPRFDYAWFQASVDGENWVALRGEHTHCGASELGPSWNHYTGSSDWVAEDLDLSPFDGAPVFVRLRLESDGAFTADGIDLRNLRLASVTSQPAELVQPAALSLRLYPNPASGQVVLTLSGLEHPGILGDETSVQVLDALGRVQLVQPWPGSGIVSGGSDQLQLQTQALNPGVYQVIVVHPTGILAQAVLAISQP